MSVLKPWSMAALAGFAMHVQALQITSMSPQGEAGGARQVRVLFDEAVVRTGDPAAAAPVALRCTDTGAAKGSGRWVNGREWVFDFEADLGPGVACTVQARPGLASAKGVELNGPRSFRFQTGGPLVQSIRPYPGSPVDEDQYFVLQLNGPASAASVAASVWCGVDGLGERVPVRLIEGQERLALLKAEGLAKVADKSPLSVLTLACNRRLTPSASLQLVYGPGVRSPGEGAAGAGSSSTIEKRFDYRVREPFAATFECERENARSACLPIRPLVLVFNAPVQRRLAEAIRLHSGTASVRPVFEQDAGDADSVVQRVSFKAPLAEQAAFTLELPKNFVDASGRALRNADNFPMRVGTGMMPVLAKFAAAPFGVVERLAEPGSVPLLPVTLRNVEADLQVQGLQPGSSGKGSVSDLQARTDADIIAWFRKVQRYNHATVARKQATRDVMGPLPRALKPDDADQVQTRMVSLLRGQPGVTTLDLPQAVATGQRPFELVGIPLSPGFHVVEIASQKLGSALLDEGHGTSRTMYVRTAALVTNLGVHFKLGRENALAWVTTLDKGRPVAGAAVRVSDCRGREVASAVTDARGVASLRAISAAAPVCQEDDAYSGAYFVSARADLAGVADMAFTWSDWNRGIEPWRFNLPTSQDPLPDEHAHTVFDRPLLRAGESVSMKHFLRTATGDGFGLPAERPTTLLVTHVGSGQQYTQALAWRTTATGGLSAENTFQVPPSAKLGAYDVMLRGPGPRNTGERNLSTGRFRVEEFRLPLLEGRITPADKPPLVNVKAVPVDVRVNFVAGGAAAGLPVQVSALVRDTVPAYRDFEAFSFGPPRGHQHAAAAGDEEDTGSSLSTPRVILDKAALTLDKSGAGRLRVESVPAARQPQELLLEASYSDPNGEMQTIRSVHTVWPAAVVAGIRTEAWVSVDQKLRFQALALDLAGKPQAGVPLMVKAVARTVTTSRKRMVGGFYTYDNQTQTRELGVVCDGRSDSRGLLLCETTSTEPGEVELVVTARDNTGNTTQAATSVYVTRQGELWFGGDNHDRIDLLPEKKEYQPGETARFQVRMPFRSATALVTVEREGILETQVVQLSGRDPTLSLPVKPGWGPNVYVSVLALRGRLHEVPWYSFFTWGYRAPREWWTSFWHEGREYVAPTAMVDLAKPAFRLGVAEIRVGDRSHQLDVRVQADKDSYGVRGQAVVRVQVRLPDGRPAAHAEVALAAVDEALLELMPNTSWNLLQAMLQRRPWGVETSTAQMEIIGRRHYGRKAVPAGGGGGRSGTRELLDTLLLWKPAVQLDAQGSATITVPLNDALSRFRIVAVADASTGLFGTGQTSIKTAQDLQIISGLPPLVREDDQFQAQFTLRNTSAAAMKVEVTPRASLLDLKPQTIDIPAGETREVAWPVTAPAQLGLLRAQAILWEIEARDRLAPDARNAARDALKARQRIVPAVPLAVQQAALVQLDGSFSLDVAPPAGALPGRGGLKLVLQPSLAEGLPGVRDWFASYPYVCLEQKASKALGLRDAGLWQSVRAQIPAYLDADGLASYFPPRDGDGHRGSDTLTAYLLAASHEASGIDPALGLGDAQRVPMEHGLIQFVEGRIQRDFWSPRKDLDVRKLAALDALSRYGKAQPRMLDSITIVPSQWPTHAVIDWLNILQRMRDLPQRDARISEARQVLRSRIVFQGSRAAFSTGSEDYWWWLMHHADGNVARLLLAVLDDPAWKDDLARLASGLIGRQQGGAWSTTTANLWGGLALQKFSDRFETTPVTGHTRASHGSGSSSVDWRRVERIRAADAPGGAAPDNGSLALVLPGMLRNNAMVLPWKDGAGQDPQKDALTVTHQGSGKPWLSLQSVAAVQRKETFGAGYQVRRTVTPVQQANRSLPPGSYTRGDVLRVTLEVNASADMRWVVITDPVPGGATILGSGLGRDSAIATQGDKTGGSGGAAFEERSFEAYRSYHELLPKGSLKLSYTLRLNNVGDFGLPPTRVEAMYAPEMFGEAPNARVRVEKAP